MLRPDRIETPSLAVRRLSRTDWALLPTDGAGVALGTLAYADQPIESAPAIAITGARALSPAEPVLEAWLSRGPFERGRCGSVHWVHNGHWLYGALEVDAAAPADSPAELSLRAYRDVFATLAQSGCAHLLRLWNYLPRINADGGGLERYRQFNGGRQQAFLEAGRPVFEGAPAACAIGTPGGPLRVSFLAGRAAPLPVENPRQVSAYHYPREYGPRSPTFSRAALLEAGAGQVALLISGTASIVGHASLHAGDVQAQLRETIANLHAVIDAAHAHCSARFDLAQADCTIYLRHADDAGPVREGFEAALGSGTPAARKAVLVHADICRSELLVEVEAHLFAPGRVGA
jgi:chorismate lyase/3-hydroxybenzoate synthase